jgi:hypothetical protein
MEGEALLFLASMREFGAVAAHRQESSFYRLLSQIAVSQVIS